MRNLYQYLLRRDFLIPFGVFLFTFLVGPYRFLEHFSNMPGDFGDTRLNNYFLESFYQYLTGNSPSFIHLNFFYPYSFVLGFSDNLLGSFPAYLLPRLITGESDTAFQLWYVFGILFNYYAAYYALRKFGVSVFGSAIGAVVFAFAFPVMSRIHHMQLHYRFGVPLAIGSIYNFMKKKDINHFMMASLWMVWQFYCSIYIGFFLLLFTGIMIVVFFTVSAVSKNMNLNYWFREITNNWCQKTSRQKAIILFAFFTLFSLMCILFYPYLMVSQMYGFERYYDEISTMLPRLHSYLMADQSYIWAGLSALLPDVPMRHEHQMFFGGTTLVLALLGVLLWKWQKERMALIVIGGSLLLLFVITIHVNDFSIWYYFSKLPLASSIRAMTRMDLVLLFPLALLAASSVDTLSQFLRRKSIKFILSVALLMLLNVEFFAISMATSSKEDWRKRIEQTCALVPDGTGGNSILFFAQKPDNKYQHSELDAMWCALNRGLPTLNGYSGFAPNGYTIEYGSNCLEGFRRLYAYLEFVDAADEKDFYLNLAERLVFVGFDGCNEIPSEYYPYRTTSVKEYSAEDISRLSITHASDMINDQKWFVQLNIFNHGGIDIACRSGIDKPIRLSWRFLDHEKNPLGGWDTRMELPFDIPADGHLTVQINIDLSTITGQYLEVSIVQEHVFWAHDIGFDTFILPLDSE